MTSHIKYSFELLQYFCNKNNVKLIDKYENQKLFGSTKINFYCTTCNKENVKCFTYLIKRNTLCKSCITIASLPKKKIQCLKNMVLNMPLKIKKYVIKLKKDLLKNGV